MGISAEVRHFFTRALFRYYSWTTIMRRGGLLYLET